MVAGNLFVALVTKRSVEGGKFAYAWALASILLFR